MTMTMERLALIALSVEEDSPDPEWRDFVRELLDEVSDARAEAMQAAWGLVPALGGALARSALGPEAGRNFPPRRTWGSTAW